PHRRDRSRRRRPPPLRDARGRHVGRSRRVVGRALDSGPRARAARRVPPRSGERSVLVSDPRAVAEATLARLGLVLEADAPPAARLAELASGPNAAALIEALGAIPTAAAAAALAALAEHRADRGLRKSARGRAAGAGFVGGNPSRAGARRGARERLRRARRSPRVAAAPAAGRRHAA